jgi:hypothetical protein
MLRIMDCVRHGRKWVPAVCALALAACGGEEPERAQVADPGLTARCELEAADGDGGFPAGLLPERSVVTSDGVAIADGKLAAVYTILKDRAEAAGLVIRDSELETLDAELELEGGDGEFGLRLGLARDCVRATEIRLAD